MSEAKIELSYWNIRGLVEPIKVLLEYLGLPYVLHSKTDFEQTFKEKAELIEKGFLFANLPFIKDGDFYLSETVAIMQYVCQKAGRKDMYDSLEDSVRFAELKGVLLDLKSGITTPMYVTANKEDLKAKLLQAKDRLKSKINGIAKLLSTKSFIFDRITFLDFYLVEVVEMILDMEKELSLNILDNHRDVYVNYVAKMYNLPKVADYRKSPAFRARPYNSPAMASWY